MSVINTSFRNHFTVIIQNIISILVLLIIIVAGAITEPPGDVMDVIMSLGILSGILVLWGLFCTVGWRKTVFTVTENEIIKEFSFIFHTKKVVNFNKIASVNIKRNFFNRLFGTSIILINVNSSVNSTVPEITFVLRQNTANAVKDELSAKMYGLHYSTEKEEVYGSVVKFTSRDAILHGMFGTSSYTFIGFVISTVITLFTVQYDSSGITVFLVLAIMSTVISMVSLILRYYNFRIYRLGDTIYVSHGAIQLVSNSFKVNKINAVKVKRTLIARLLGKGCIEVEVVGLGAENGAPVICILTSMENVNRIIDEIVPDFKYEIEGMCQPSSAAIPWLMKAAIGSGVTIALAAAVVYVGYKYADFIEYLGVDFRVFLAAAVGCIAVLALIYFGLAHMAFHSHRIDLGKDTFLVEFGIIDRTRAVIQYDRVQTTDVSSSPAPRRLGLSRVKVSLLSSVGRMQIQSGYFRTEDLERISETVMARLSSGEYDYRKLL